MLAWGKMKFEASLIYFGVLMYGENVLTNDGARQRVRKARKATVREKQRKVVVDLELLGKLPPPRSYMCPLFFEAVPDFDWIPAAK
jgi:hypothetical protein